MRTPARHTRVLGSPHTRQASAVTPADRDEGKPPTPHQAPDHQQDPPTRDTEQAALREPQGQESEHGNRKEGTGVGPGSHPPTVRRRKNVGQIRVGDRVFGATRPRQAAPTRNHGFGAKAAITLHTENHTRLSRKARRRPIRSARRPNTAAPMNMPRNDEASTAPEPAHQGHTAS